MLRGAIGTIWKQIIYQVKFVYKNLHLQYLKRVSHDFPMIFLCEDLDFPWQSRKVPRPASNDMALVFELMEGPTLHEAWPGKNLKPISGSMFSGNWISCFFLFSGISWDFFKNHRDQMGLTMHLVDPIWHGSRRITIPTFGTEKVNERISSFRRLIRIASFWKDTAWHSAPISKPSKAPRNTMDVSPWLLMT